MRCWAVCVVHWVKDRLVLTYTTNQPPFLSHRESGQCLPAGPHPHAAHTCHAAPFGACVMRSVPLGMRGKRAHGRCTAGKPSHSATASCRSNRSSSARLLPSKRVSKAFSIRPARVVSKGTGTAFCCGCCCIYCCCCCCCCCCYFNS